MSSPRSVPEIRIRPLNDAEPNPDGRFVLYWMIAARRRHSNFGLQRAALLARERNLPLVVLEALRVGYPWASDRMHAFVMQGMKDNLQSFDGPSCTYLPYLEREAGAGSGLLEALAAQAHRVVTDDYPTFFLPRMLKAAGRKLKVAIEAVDSNGLLPMRAADKTFARAHDFRRFLQKNLPQWLESANWPVQDPLANLELPRASGLEDVLARWPMATAEELDDPAVLAALPIDHDVGVSPVLRGGARAAGRQWGNFESQGLPAYADGRNHPDEEVASGLSPWLHFGHIGVHDVFERLRPDGWAPEVLGKATGKREGWWQMDAGREAFLDELVTWREVGFNMAHREQDHESYAALPDWARQTLEEHEDDEREHVYDLETFEAAETHDEVWNAAQRQLKTEGRMHNYLRMLWGKKVLHWTKRPEDATEILIELNNKYALDGRDPNSYSGIFWVFGRYDRAWGPERPIFGKIRYMTSDSTLKKLKMKAYLQRWGA